MITPGGRDLWVDFGEVIAQEHSPVRTERLSELVRQADAIDAPRLTFIGRRVLSDAHRTDGRWDLVWPLLAQCLDEHQRRADRFERDDVTELLSWYAFLVEAMTDFPDRPLDLLDAAVRDLERRYREADLPLTAVYGTQRGIAAHVGDWDRAEAAFLRQIATTAVNDPWLDVIRVAHLIAKGEEAQALDVAAPVIADSANSGEQITRVRNLVLLPLARAGRWEEAALTYRRLTRGMSGEYALLEDLGGMAEFCALTGNLGTGAQWLVPDFEQRGRPLATMEYAASIAVLMRRLGDPEANRLHALATDLAGQFDRRNGTSAVGDRIRAKLAAEPLIEFLPILPTSRPPLPGAPDLPDAELLDRAEWHDLRCEPEEARACLAAVSPHLPPPLAARRAELTAKFFQSPETGDVLRHSIRTYLLRGDRARAWLSRCWLGLWMLHEGNDGITAIQQAVEALHELGEHQAWGEYWLAYALSTRERTSEALEAVARGLRHAGDPLVRGTLQLLEASLTGIAPHQAYETLLRGDVPEKALEALYQLEDDLGRVSDHPRVDGHLRYLRAVRTIEAGRPDQAVDDLNEAVGQAERRGNATVQQWCALTQANHAAGLTEDAIDSGIRAVAWLDHLRDNEDPAWAQAADETRYLIAECYQRLGDLPAAIKEYRMIAAGDGPLAASAFVAASELLATRPGTSSD